MSENLVCSACVSTLPAQARHLSPQGVATRARRNARRSTFVSSESKRSKFSMAGQQQTCVKIARS
eukprot:14531112-Heterocapsa_arctica.AAC.1